MKRKTVIELAVIVLLGIMTIAFAASAWAGERSPGRHCGTVVFDRWDGCILYSGIYVMYVAERVKDGLRDHAGESVQIHAQEVYQPRNPGDGLISAFEYLGPAPPAMNWIAIDGLELRVSPQFKNGERPVLEISVRNRGKEDVKVFSAHLAPTLLTQTSSLSRRFLPADGPSFALVTRQAFIVGGAESRTKGRGSLNGQSYAWSIDEALPKTFVLKPNEERNVLTSFELPKGEYDFLAGYGGGVHEGKGIASNLVAFDVTGNGEAQHVKISDR